MKRQSHPFDRPWGASRGRSLGAFAAPAAALLAVLVLAGCAVYPAVQVASGAMTGYDAVVLADEYIPKNSVSGGQLVCDSDRMLERRLRERLIMGGVPQVSAHVIGGHAYLVGQLDNRGQADRAVSTARNVEGLKFVTCKFFPPSTPAEARSDASLLYSVSRKLSDTKRLESAYLRVEVIGGTAILIGATADHSQKTAALAIAGEVWGVRDVVDYIAVNPTIQSAQSARAVRD
ncbi:BON domain-containing protein [Pseudodesulfovibrio sp. F-1]|uniref:BON domain-containing protein n=1 Tax=Pseudodesulfovibrio alkaliphilus TaxID=2661613 RepID=A0A7K1KJR1_9BACT|nr:BON domain-containing protein [Pseudodesulfovibrio alkaliphilus]MUM76275.1 BON domain-containing protein [Pseudodesulfovibrio alkaliphilus]